MAKIDIICSTLGRQIDVPEHFSVRTHYNFNRLCYVRHGSTVYTDENGEVTLEEGYVYLLPMKAYSLRPTQGRTFDHFWCHFQWKGFPYDSVLRISPDDDRMYPLYLSLLAQGIERFGKEPDVDHDATEHTVLTSEHPYFSVLSGVLTSFLELYHLTSHHERDADDNLAHIVEYINDHPGEDLSNERLARIAMYNKIYFIQKFTAKYDLSPQKYVLRVRISEAIVMLMNDEKVDDIAYRLGYESPKSFSRAFKREVGISPQHYKILHYYNLR